MTCAQRSAPLEDSAVDIATLAAAIAREEEKTNPNVVKVIGKPLGPKQHARAKSSPVRPRRPAPGRIIITSVSMRIAARRWSGSSNCRRRRTSSASGSSNCERSTPACASTLPLSAACRSGSIRRTISNAPASCSVRTGVDFTLVLRDTLARGDACQRRSHSRVSPARTRTSRAARLIPRHKPLPCATFEDAFAAVRSGRADLAMIPIDNSVAGRVADIHHLMPDSGLHIVAEWFLPVQHQLMAPNGATLEDDQDGRKPHPRARPVPQNHPQARREGRRRRRHRRLGTRSRGGRRHHPRVARDLAGGKDLRLEDLEEERRGRARTTPRASSCSRASRNGQAATASGGRSRLLFSRCATCRPRSTRRSADSPPTAST